LEIAVASGKGGTGKTFVSSNLLYYLDRFVSRSVGVDADAEAPDLAIACGGSKRVVREEAIYESYKARIDRSRCVKCLRCVEVCAFSAIEVEDSLPRVDEVLCEGCGACAFVCPARCIEIYSVLTGRIRVEETRLGITVVSADLEVGARSTGHLVYRCREVASEVARSAGARHLVIDVAAGIGCAVVSAIASVDKLIVVVEPLPPSIAGARRLVELARRFGIEPIAIVNKFDLDPSLARRVGDELGVEVAGYVPFDPLVFESYARMEPVLHRYPDSPSSRALREIFSSVV